jgi:hypothetical protein
MYSISMGEVVVVAGAGPLALGRRSSGKEVKRGSFKPRNTPFTLTATTGSDSVGGPLVPVEPRADMPANPPPIGTGKEEVVAEDGEEGEEGEVGHVRLLRASTGRHVGVTERGADNWGDAIVKDAAFMPAAARFVAAAAASLSKIWTRLAWERAVEEEAAEVEEDAKRTRVFRTSTARCNM